MTQARNSMPGWGQGPQSLGLLSAHIPASEAPGPQTQRITGILRIDTPQHPSSALGSQVILCGGGAGQSEGGRHSRPRAHHTHRSFSSQGLTSAPQRGQVPISPSASVPTLNSAPPLQLRAPNERLLPRGTHSTWRWLPIGACGRRAESEQKRRQQRAPCWARVA